MAKTPNYSTSAPMYTASGIAGHSHGNVTLTGGGAGMTYTTATGAGNWATTAATPWYPKQPKVQITDSDIEIDGLSLHKTLITMHERMAIMQPNPALEKEFNELKECADRYRELEQKYLDQKRMWETLKK